ncbi:hypothetical protein [Pseudoalteromonas sp. A757]|nr:hypothetical protein [Pseudoalteromonas sp. A757]MBE0375968.1 hypothetical protein [Pseudoalteromonas flavipulchra NCIMB 2033 = ATCC BAA-314]
MKAIQKNPTKMALSRSLCKQIYGGIGTSKGEIPRGVEAEATKPDS